MPVPRVGFFASNVDDFGPKSVFLRNRRTIVGLDIVIAFFFGASMIGCTITG